MTINSPGVLWSIVFVAVVSAGTIVGAADCTVDPMAVSRLRAYLSYRNGLSSNRSIIDTFSAISVNGSVYFRQQDLEPNAPEQTVYVLRPKQPIISYSCPMDGNWLRCASILIPTSQGDSPETIHMRQELARAEQGGASCRKTLRILPWTPSPKSTRKKELADRVLRSLEEFGYHTLKVVYARDFNLVDPEIELYVIDGEGQEDFLGCALRPGRSDVCDWHRFGQAPLDKLRADIMKRPLILFQSQKPKP